METCGAKTRAGTPCKHKAMENGRCKLHGGKSTGPPLGSQNALKHGFYSDILTEPEQECYGTASIDDALNMAYVQHKRALVADRMELADKALGRIAQLEKTRAEIVGDDDGLEIDDIEAVPH